ncbi:MAG: SH3 domain-containing protein [Pseudomonadota bacterium]
MKTLKNAAILVGLALATSTVGVSQAYAGTCPSRVKGLSSNYNKAKGNGFLAVRSRPSTKSRELGELFNGDVIEVYSKRGRWLEVEWGSGSAYVFGKYVRLGCSGGELN